MLSSVPILLLSVHLAVAPAEPVPAAAGAAAEAPRREGPLTLAAPGFTTVNVTPEMATFLNDHFAQQLTLAGLRVITASEIQALVGLERQKQLLGCAEDESSCMTEVANALGADGLVTASVGKFGDSYQVNTKILGPDGKPLTVSSSRVTGDTAVLDELTRVARAAASELRARANRPEAPAGAVAVSGTEPAHRPLGKAVSATNIPTGFLLVGVPAMVLGGMATLGGLAATFGGAGGKGLLFAAGGAALGVGGWYLLEVGKQKARDDARRNALVTERELHPGAFERAQAQLPPVRSGLEVALRFP